ncbi:MAG: redox-sensitive transcriptional activator SoxR [Streptosporangiaceae bacterium]
MVASTLSIGEVAERTGVSPPTLRFYEAQGLISSERTDGNQRRFRRDQVRRVTFVKVAQRLGLSLDDIRTALGRLPARRTPTKADWAALSRAWRPMLDEQIAILERLRDQLDSCIGCGCLSLKACALYNPDDAARSLGTGARYILGNDRPPGRAQDGLS